MTNRVVTPVNLKERIALLQQKASNGASTSGVGATSPTSAGVSLSTSASATAGNSGSALRERIAKFEQKGGVPVPRGSFGIGAPPLALEQTHEGKAARKKGELYGNRIASVARHQTGNASPPSALRPHLTGNVDIITASSRSLIPSTSTSSGLDVPGDGSPVRKRCVSTSSLATKRPASASDLIANELIMSGTFDDDGDASDSLMISGSQLFASNDSQAQTQCARRISISGADAMSPFGSDTFYGEATFSSTTNNNTQPSQLDRSQESNLPESVPKPASFNDHHDHVIREDQRSVPGQRADSVALSPEEAPPTDSTKQRIEQDIQDESSVKTPVVATFSPSSDSVIHAKEGASSSDTLDVPSEDPELSDASTPFTDASSPLNASFEVGERVHCEPRKYVIIPPSRTSTLDQSELTSSVEASREHTSAENSASALGSSGTKESRASTETVGPVSNLIPPPDVAEKSPDSPQSTGSNSIRRRNIPAPLVIQHEKEYSEPSLDPKVGPKSFHAVVHGRTTLPTRIISRNSNTTTTAPRPRVNVTRPKGGTPGTPGSPDLSALLEQAMYLEQRLVGGESDVVTPRPEENSFQRSETKPDMDGDSKSQVSQVVFPRSGNEREPRGDVVPTPPPKNPNPRSLSQVVTNVGPGSRKSWSRSSGNASSEDSVPVLTPPSPTFDLAAPVLCEEPQQLSIGGDATGVDERGEGEGRRSISSVLSSPGKSARKKVLSLFSRSGYSSSTLALPDDLLPSETNTNLYRNSGSAFSSVSVCPSSTLLPSPAIKETDIAPLQFPPSSLLSTSPSHSYGPPSPISPNLRVKHDTPDVPRPVSVVSTTSVCSNAPSPLAIELFDSFPDVPRSVPNSFEQDRMDGPEMIDMLLESLDVKEVVKVSEKEKVEDVVQEVEEEPESPRPPTPPPKDYKLRDAAEEPSPIPPLIKVDQLTRPPSNPPPPYSCSQYNPESQFQPYQQPGAQPQSCSPPSPPSKDISNSPSIRTSSSISSLSFTPSSHPPPRRSKSKSSLRLPHLYYLSSSHPPTPPLPSGFANGNGHGHAREKSDCSSCTSDKHSQTHTPPFPPSSFPNTSTSTFSASTSSSSSSTGILGAISRSLSSRRKRKNSNASALSVSTGHG